MTETSAHTRPQILKAIVAGGLTGATGDFISAMLIYHLPPLTVGKAVARGWFGNASMQMGNDVAVIGIVSHYAIVLVAAAIFVLASLRFPVLRRRAWIVGPLFGLCIYLTMHFVVLPLSAVHATRNPKGLQLIEELVGHMFLVGLPIALWARAMLRRA
jgi:uncharacterized membrane protein YagU involved in acid resistance